MMAYRADIDGLRALAVGIVILFHAGFTSFEGGFVGVDVFFVISGYLITQILHRELSEDRFSLARFYERRARRILPALFLIMALCIPAAMLIMLPFERQALSQAMVASTLFSSNILFWLKSGYFDTAAELNPLLHTWSLAVEEQFYIGFPLLLMALKGLSRRSLAIVISVLCLVSLVLAEIFSRTHPMAAFYLIPFRAWEMGAGAVLALTIGGRPVGGRWCREVGALAGLGLIAWSAFTYDKGTPFPGVWAIAPVAGSCMIIAFAGSRTFVGKMLSLPPIVGLGLISYSAYLWHQPLFAFARLNSYHDLDATTLWALIGATLVLSWLSWKLVETPFRNGKLFTVPRLSGALAPVAVALLAVGGAGHLTKGLSSDTGGHIQQTSDDFFTYYTDRLELIGSGVCHYNTRGQYTELDDFVVNWNCGADPSEASGEAEMDADPVRRIAVFGDSVAADMAAALRINGIEPVQMTGAGCDLSPRLQTPTCATLSAAFQARLADMDVDEIWLTNAFDKVELSPKELRAGVAPWAEFGVPVRLWSPLPRYGAIQRAYLERLVEGTWPDGLYRDEDTDRFLTVTASMDLPENVRVWDTRDIFCQITDDCSHVAGETLLVIDEHSHLSTEGARRYGELLVATVEPVRPRTDG